MIKNNTTYALILAAGKGTRLKLDVPKVLALMRGKPMIFWIIEALVLAGIHNIIVVIGHRADEVKQSIQSAGYDVKFVLQEQQIGTGNAVQIAMKEVPQNAKTVLVTYGDKPLISSTTFQQLVQKQQKTSVVQIITAVECQNASEMGFGRIKRDAKGTIMKMIEQKECDSDDLKISECNGGPVAYDAAWLRNALDRSVTGPSGEIYLTDLVRLAYEEGKQVEVVPMSGLDEAHGINTLEHLQEAEHIFDKMS